MGGGHECQECQNKADGQESHSRLSMACTGAIRHTLARRGASPPKGKDRHAKGKEKST